MIGESWGLLVKSRASVFLPQTPKTYFEVFPLKLYPDCSTRGWTKESLIEDYSIGSEVRVIAKKAVSLPPTFEPGRIRLEVPAGDYGVRKIIDAYGTRTLDDVYDYTTRAFKVKSNAEAAAEWEFEMRKDLLRLSKTKSEQQKIEVLRRLAYYPSVWDGLDYSELVNTYLRKGAVARSLIKRREFEEQRQRDAAAKYVH
jgi:hypothetical protein